VRQHQYLCHDLRCPFLDRTENDGGFPQHFGATAGSRAPDAPSQRLDQERAFAELGSSQFADYF
jgi:hypothetical protein